MNEVDLKIMGLYVKIERNIKLSKQLKVLAGVCLFFSICYCFGTKSIGNINKDQVLLTKIVWIISIIVLVGTYIIDSYCVKNNKAYELDIYRLEVEDLNAKKNYSILLGLDIIIRIFLIKIY